MSLPALTLHQPWASLVALGVKTIETRSWSAPKSLIGQRLLIHSAKQPNLEYDPDTRGGWMNLHWSNTAPLGAILCSVRVVDCVPIMASTSHVPRPKRYVLTRLPVPTLLLSTGQLVPFFDDITDQLPYGDFAPGRFAWLFADVRRVEDECPACEGRKGTSGSIPYEYARWKTPCAICDGQGRCSGPIPAKGRQRVWEWTP